MASAWQQVDGVRAANDMLHQAQLARAALQQIYRAQFVKAQPETVMNCHRTAALQVAGQPAHGAGDGSRQPCAGAHAVRHVPSRDAAAPASRFDAASRDRRCWSESIPATSRSCLRRSPRMGMVSDRHHLAELRAAWVLDSREVQPLDSDRSDHSARDTGGRSRGWRAELALRSVRRWSQLQSELPYGTGLRRSPSKQRW